MDAFTYKNGQLMAEQVSLHTIAERFDTPCFVYSRSAIESQWYSYDQAFHGRKHLICYAVKANSNLAIINLLARLGSGFDIVSVGELERVLEAGGDASRIVFSGVGKKPGEMQRALEAGIKCFNVESQSELRRLNEVASGLGISAPVSLRINPDVDAATHPYISTGLNKNKFGIQYNDALRAYELADSLSHIELHGIDCHIGSQITSVEPYIDSLQRLLRIVEQLKQEGIQLRHIDIGGGMGVRYQNEKTLNINDFITDVCNAIPDQEFEIVIEPGRSIVANAGILLTRIEYLKDNIEKNFAIVDAAMNDLLRPALYQAWQEVLPVNEKSEVTNKRYDIVGPICETGDFIALDRELNLSEGDLLAICSSGAYGFSMSSNYNSRPRAAEIMVTGTDCHEIRRRESIQDLFQGESMLPD